MIPDSMQSLPKKIEHEETLDDVLTAPRAELVEFVSRLKSPLVILGAGGKMGPTLAVLARRAAQAAGHELEVVAVSRFQNERLERDLEDQGVTTISCDLLERAELNRLPRSENVIYLAGYKFGTAEKPWMTWAINTIVPTHTAEYYAGARIVALSTGNVYPLVPVEGGGAVETDSLVPAGEYANAAIGRERIFQYYSIKDQTSVALVRLNYAVELRYGVLVDIAMKVASGEPVDVTMGYLNCIWQGDANEYILRLVQEARVPASVFNLTGPKVLSVRELALEFGRLMDRPVEITGTEQPTALLSNPGRVSALFGEPPTGLETVMRWTADWILNGGPLLGRATHFEVRDGKY